MDSLKRFSFSKNEKLCYKPAIDELFAKGEQVFQYPFKLLFKRKDLPDGLPTQVLFSVPKRTFKLATDRNTIKRRLREVYRLHKHLFQDKEGKCTLQYIAIVYVAKEKLAYQELKRKFIQISKKI
jgi:ribonuclease P protein component